MVDFKKKLEESRMATRRTLDDKIKDSMRQGQQHGSFAPPAKAKSTAEPLRDLREVVESTIDQKILARQILEYREYQQAEREAKALKDNVGTSIKERLAELGVQKFQVEDLRVNYSKSQRKTIKKDLLLANGVRPDVIEESTKVTDVTMLTIRGIDEPDYEAKD